MGGIAGFYAAKGPKGGHKGIGSGDWACEEKGEGERDRKALRSRVRAPLFLFLHPGGVPAGFACLLPPA